MRHRHDARQGGRRTDAYAGKAGGVVPRQNGGFQMTRQTRVSTAPAAIATFWGIDDAALMRVEEAYRAWFEASEDIQRQALAYVNGCFAKNSALFADMAKCKNPLELVKLHSGYAGDALDDFVESGRRMAAVIEQAARKALPEGAA
jgi:hypothetical protein